MTTKFIGTKELRQNLFTISKEVGEGKVSYVVMNKNKPLLTMTPFIENNVELVPSKRLRVAIRDAEKEYKNGKMKSFASSRALLKHLNA